MKHIEYYQTVCSLRVLSQEVSKQANKYIRIRTALLKLKFHRDQFPRNFPVANVTGKSPTSYEEVGRVGRVASLLRGSYEEADDFQTISTCQDGVSCR